jgi:large subunit ribosomal protein L24
MMKIKKGDEVIVITGKDKGKKGVILSLVDNGMKLIVDGINLAKKHVKANPNANQQGGIIEKPMAIHRSNVMLYDQSKGKGSRIGIRNLTDGKRVRYYKTSDQLVETQK